ncbi:hypothetical protein CJU90_4752 [Yarrowia sp. C11]|nr:hypothetical protein CJU90_4752 [Yarrowia sp. C11]KAG5364574.1 hypothetical protein CKK34_3385 [Yarrowia sp. E02]
MCHMTAASRGCRNCTVGLSLTGASQSQGGIIFMGGVLSTPRSKHAMNSGTESHRECPGNPVSIGGFV